VVVLWPHAASRRYSPLAQITPENAADQKVAKADRTGDVPKSGESSHSHEFDFEATPIKVGDSPYLCAAHRLRLVEIVGLRAETPERRCDNRAHHHARRVEKPGHRL
jgi:quinoprotein glucose dehydrogenase